MHCMRFLNQITKKNYLPQGINQFVFEIIPKEVFFWLYEGIPNSKYALTKEYHLKSFFALLVFVAYLQISGCLFLKIFFHLKNTALTCTLLGFSFV
jgi:hypothetical protein